MDSTKNIDQKIDNELKKKELSEKYGGGFMGANPDLPPEIEGEWLNHIEKFEEQYENAKRIKVIDCLGNIEFKRVTDLAKEDIKQELDKLQELLAKNGIQINTLCEVEDEELYRFITEELFNEEMDDMNIPGMMNCYIYEEFHPNAKYDIEEAFDYFFRCTLGKCENYGGEGYDMLYLDTENFQNTEGKFIPQQELEKKITNFLKSFDQFKVESLTIKELSVNSTETDGKVTFTIHYKGLFDMSKEQIDFKGEGTFRFRPSEYGGWRAYSIQLPGLSL